MLPIAFIWGLIDFSFFSLAFHQEGFPKEMGVFLIGFFALHLMPVWIYLAGIIFSFLRYQNTSFAITDQGVYISSGMFTQNYERKPFAEMSHVNLSRGIIDRMIGVGDVVMTSQADRYVTRNPLIHGTSICDIKDYAEVYQIVLHEFTDKEFHGEVIYSLVLRRLECRCRFSSCACFSLDELGKHLKFIFIIHFLGFAVEHRSREIVEFCLKIFFSPDHIVPFHQSIIF